MPQFIFHLARRLTAQMPAHYHSHPGHDRPRRDTSGPNPQTRRPQKLSALKPGGPPKKPFGNSIYAASRQANRVIKPNRHRFTNRPDTAENR